MATKKTVKDITPKKPTNVKGGRPGHVLQQPAKRARRSRAQGIPK